MLDVKGLSRNFYGVQALQSADLEVRPGTITGLIGPNGAGKTTLFNCISGVIPPDEGEVTFDGQDITGCRPETISQRGMVRTFQIARGLPRLTVLENLLLYGTEQPGEHISRLFFKPGAVKSREKALTEQALEIAGKLRLTEVLNNRADEVSGGQKKLLEIGRALMTQPKLILLDEPIAGVNPRLSREIADQLIRLKEEEDLTFLIIEHDMDLIARLCDPVIVMANGRRLAEGSFSDITEHPDVQEAYLGSRKWAS
ncbi:MAG: ABC transporter ATP-binding protein [Pseudomonadota bacterium]